MNPLEQVDPAWAWQSFTPSDASPWNRRTAGHLFRRAAFGASQAQLDVAVLETPAAVVEKLVAGKADSQQLQTDVDDLARAILATGDAKQLAAWWAYVLLQTGHPLLERMTLFWHGHFATSADKVADAGLMLEQNRLLRRHALGDFRALAQDISRDPAMLLYLDSATNRKAHPNENYARELMELFCLGEGNYSEQDVQQLARCFTGWEIKGGGFRFNRFQHDAAEKTILNRTKSFPEGEAIDWVVDQPQTARFLVGKLFRQFISDEPAPPASLVEPLVMELREHQFQIAHVLRRMLGSQLFFSTHAIGRKIRSPVDLAVGLLRSLEATTNSHQLAADLLQNGQGLFYPPNVKGWDGGRAWINASTVLGRANMVRRLLAAEHTRFGGGKLDEYFSKQLKADSAEQVVDQLAELLLAVPLTSAARDQLIGLYRKSADRSRAIANTIHALAALPEFQLG